MTEQLSIDFARTHARRRDPEVSHEAARKAQRFAQSHAGRILIALLEHGPKSKDELAKLTGLTAVQVDRRLPDLERAGKAVPTGMTRLSSSGRDERVWRAV